jgi:hypothetical protein
MRDARKPTTDIRDILEREGIAWRNSGYMHCPACGKDKVTAKESINFAQCWSCGRRWHPAFKRDVASRSWATVFISNLVEPIRHALSGSDAYSWLVDKRGLPANVCWLNYRDIGAIPDKASFLQRAKEAARAALEEARQGGLGNLTEKEDSELEEKLWEFEEKRMETTFEKADSLFDGSWVGSVVFIYRNAGDDPISLNVRNVRKEIDGDRHIFRLQPISGRRGVFCPHRCSGGFWKSDSPVIVEGEINWLQAQAYAHQRGSAEAKEEYPGGVPTGIGACLHYEAETRYMLAGMAVGGKNGADITTIKQICRDMGVPPTVLYDNDAIGDDGMPGGYALVRSINQAMPCYVNTTPTKDLDDFLTNTNPSPAQLKTLLEEKIEYLPRPIEAIRDEVNEITYSKKLTKKAKTDKVAELVLADMLERGRFFNVGGMGVFLWEDESHVIEIGKGQETWREYMLNYNIKPGEDLCDDIGLFIGTKCSDPTFAPRNKLRVLSLYDQRTRCAYINEYEGAVIKIDGRSGDISRVVNGTDDVLFRTYKTVGGLDAELLPVTSFQVDINKAQKSRSGLKLEPGSLLDRQILSSIKYSPDSPVPELTAKQLLKAQILSMLLPDMFHTKAMPVFEGVRGAGKTTMGTFVGKLLVGEKFAPTKMPDDPDKLALLFTSKSFLVLDEWNQRNKSVEEKFRALSTGEWDTRREYYTTRKMVDTEPQAHAWLSANTVGAKNEATSRRLLIIDVAPRQEQPTDAVFRSVRKLTEEFMSVRDDIWTEVVGCLKNVIMEFHSLPEQPTSFSMADFGAFFVTVAKAEGWEETASRMLVEMQARQLEQSAKGMEVVALLSELLDKMPSYVGKYRTANEWAVSLVALVPDNDVELRRKLTANYLSWAFKAAESTFKEIFGMKIEKDNHRKTMLYAFFPDHNTIEVEPEPRMVTAEELFA